MIYMIVWILKKIVYNWIMGWDDNDDDHSDDNDNDGDEDDDCYDDDDDDCYDDDDDCYDDNDHHKSMMYYTILFYTILYYSMYLTWSPAMGVPNGNPRPYPVT